MKKTSVVIFLTQSYFSSVFRAPRVLGILYRYGIPDPGVHATQNRLVPGGQVANPESLLDRDGLVTLAPLSNVHRIKPALDGIRF